MRAQLVGRLERRIVSGSSGLPRPALNLRDATVVSVLAYAGLRPQELRGLRWANVRERTLLIGAPKTGRRRSVRLLEHLAADLQEWRIASRHSQHTHLVFTGEDGGEWTAEGFNKWRGRVFGPTVRAVGLDHARPYDLRHSFA